MAERKTTKLKRSNILLMIVSLIIAVIIWTVLVITQYPEVTVNLRDVPIDFDMTGSYASLAGYSVISKDAETVSVSFTGLRYLIDDYENSDIRVRMNLDNVRASGTYDIPLVVTSERGDQISNIEIYPQTVHVEFDRISTKELSVEDGSLTVDISNLRTAAGYVIDPQEIVITPSRITISGPQDYVEQVTSCVLRFDPVSGIKASANFSPSEAVLYNGTAVFDNSRVSQSTGTFNVFVPVYTTKTLPLRVTIQGNPDKIDTSTIPYTLSTDSILVRSQNSAIDEIEDINLGYIDTRDIVPGYAKTFIIGESSYYTNASGVEEVQVMFDLEGYATKSITLSNSQIFLLNKPSDYNVTVEQDILRIMVVGPEEVLETLDASNFVAEIDLLAYPTETGMRFLTASVYAPDHPEVWTAGLNQVYASYEPAADDFNAADEGE